MTQYSLKKGLKLFGKRGATVVLKEIQQPHDMDSLEPKKNLTHKECAESLTYLMYLKEKNMAGSRDVDAPMAEKRLHSTKYDATSPTWL